MMITRRRLLALLPAFGVGSYSSLAAQGHIFSRKSKPHAPAAPLFVFFGTDTIRSSAKGIYSSRFDPATGHLTEAVLAAPTVRPSFFAWNQLRGKRLLYAINEGDEQTSAVSTFGLDPSSGSLTLLGQVSAGGSGPCYIAVDATGRSAFVANYGGGTVSSFLVQPDGTLSEPVERVNFHDEKVLGRPSAASPHPHSSMISPDNRFLIVNDLGNNAIATLPIDVQTARMGGLHLFPNRNAGAGPRHMAFHPNGRWAYGIDELSSKIDHYLWNSTHDSKGVPAEALLTDTGHTVSTLDAGYHGTNSAAEIAVSPDGAFVYASNRGEDTLVVFAVGSTTGQLTLSQRIACGGRTPRHFTLDPSGQWLLCGNLESASMTVFARNASSGRLTGTAQMLAIEAPMFTLFA